MKVRLSKLALAELDVILSDIRAANPLAAARFEARIKHVFERIAQFPKCAQEVENRPGIRRVPLVRYSYVVHYAIIDGEVMIFESSTERDAIRGNDKLGLTSIFLL